MSYLEQFFRATQKPRRYKNIHLFDGDKFKFGKLILKVRFSNIFVTFLDKFDRVISVHTAGTAGIFELKRRKIAPFAMGLISVDVAKSFTFQRVRAYNLYFFTLSALHVYFLIKGLSKRRIRVLKYYFCLNMAHNGTRARRLRRL